MHPEAALRFARTLLRGGSRYAREANVTYDAARLLSALDGVEDADIEREHVSGGGRIDIFLPRFRTVIEVKRPGAGTYPFQGIPGRASPALEQLERYIAAEIIAEQKRLNFSGAPLAGRRWTGILADGRNWSCWTYSAGGDAPAETRRWSFHLGPGARPEELLDALAGALDPDPDLKTWIPADPSELFEGRADELADLYESMPGRVRPGAQTKLALWHDMLRASGLSPQGRAGDGSRFALHSFLIAVARMVTHLLSPAGGHWTSCLQDGFASWMLDWPGGREWAESVWDTVRRYDWRSRRGDVLRALYEGSVPPGDRHVFGEFYTPDWLAGMMVEQALDDDWLERAVPAAEVALQTGKTLEGIGVLDPACGSGTFLYHSARRILEADAMRDLLPQQQADVAAMLLNGIDVHPVAVEVAKATVLRALPAEPRAGAAAIRIYLGDSLLTDEDHSSLFGHRSGAMRLETPQGAEFFIPLEFVRQDHFADSMRRLVLSAVERKPVPPVLLQGVGENARADLEECREALEGAVQQEGNSVWTWYAINRAAPHLLAERKVDRIVANPPWVKLSSIQEYGRKKAMGGMGERLGLQAGGRQAPHLDIAAFFVLRARELYLQDPDRDRGVWLVKRSALGAGHWDRFRKLHKDHLTQTVDLLRLQPFGGGDARRCCLLAEHTAFPAANSRSKSAPRLEARLRSPAHGRPAPTEGWQDVRQYIRLVTARPPPPRAPSGYAPQDFRQGATVLPHVLVVARVVAPQGPQRVRVETRPSLHRPWSEVPPQSVEVPRSWVSALYLSSDLLVFAVTHTRTQAIVPADDDGTPALESAADEPGWQVLNELYERHRGKGGNTPRTLPARLDYAGHLSSQPRGDGTDRRMVLYPKSGDIMRSARIPAGSGFVGDPLYWHVAASEEEAGYLVSLLNAPSLRRAFRESRASGRDFHQHPWRNVPIPRFDPQDRHHQTLAALCSEAEAQAEGVRDLLAGKGQVAISKAIRRKLVECGIASRIDALAARLLPDQAEA